MVTGQSRDDQRMMISLKKTLNSRPPLLGLILPTNWITLCNTYITNLDNI